MQGYSRGKTSNTAGTRTRRPRPHSEPRWVTFRLPRVICAGQQISRRLACRHSITIQKAITHATQSAAELQPGQEEGTNVSAQVEIGRIMLGGASNCVGVFSGQNMQNDWDSHSHGVTSFGGIFGDRCYAFFQQCSLVNTSQTGQILFDHDTKLNQSPMYVGP